MEENPQIDVTEFLHDIEQGNQNAADRLLPLIYEDLRAVAGALMWKKRTDWTLQPTALVHEAYLRLVKTENQDWTGRKHFFDVAAMAMRQLLVNEAKRRRAKKRGGALKRVVLPDWNSVKDNRIGEFDALDLSELLNQLEAIDPRQSRIVELRFFAGLKVNEIAEILGVSDRTIRLDWRMAKAWLHRELDRKQDS